MRLDSLATVLFSCSVLSISGACGDDDGVVDGGMDVDGGMPVDSGSDGGDSGEPPTDGGMDVDGATDLPVTLHFAGRVGAEDFMCGTTFSGLGTASTDVVGADFRFYVSNVRLVTGGGAEVPVALEQDGMFQVEDVALLDFEDGTGACMSGNAALRSEVVGTVPAGDYTGVRFVLGVPFDMNHADVTTAPPPLNISGMWWVWQGGHKFLRVDLGVAGGGYNMHLGSTMCASGAPTEPPTAECMRPNRAEVSLDGFDLASSVIVADLAALVADVDVTVNTAGTPPGCQSFPTDEADCLAVFPKLGLDYATGAAGSTEQSFFHLE